MVKEKKSVYQRIRFFFSFKDLPLFKAFWVTATAVWKANLAEVINYGTCKLSLLPLSLLAECE